MAASRVLLEPTLARSGLGPVAAAGDTLVIREWTDAGPSYLHIHYSDEGRLAETQGVEVSLVLNEAEPIGAFVGISISEPLLQGGLLLSVFGYMVYLNPLMAVVAFAVFTPQLVFVPLMQRAINRRVGTRIRVLRQISAGIIGEPGGGADAGSPQDGRIQSVFALNMGILELKFSMNFLMNMMHHIGLAAILALGGYYVVTGKTEIGTVVAFVSGLAQVNDPWGDLVNWYRDLKVTQTKYDLIVRALTMLRGRDSQDGQGAVAPL